MEMNNLHRLFQIIAGAISTSQQCKCLKIGSVSFATSNKSSGGDILPQHGFQPYPALNGFKLHPALSTYNVEFMTLAQRFPTWGTIACPKGYI